MSDWTAGYVADIDYTYGYYLELNPLRAKLAFLNAGLVCPQFGTACELGFGQGLSANIHAAASVTEWHGTDFNPAQASFAQELARASGAKAKLYDESFAEFSSRADLPDFDYIGLHGIWSWVSAENRAVLVDFIRRKLKVGGVLFISYNTMPGWSQFAPMRHLMTEHAKVMGSEGPGILKRIEGALAFGESLLASNPAFATSNPQVAPRLQKVKELSRHYLAHEYFNRDWHPMYFSDMAGLLSQAKMTYACSAHLIEQVEVMNFTAEQLKLLREIPSPAFRESVRDFMNNQQFRRDYWVKGARALDLHEKERIQSALQFVLAVPRENVPLKLAAGLGEIKLKEDLYGPLLDMLADNKPHSFSAMAQVLGKKNITPAHLQEMLIVLCGSGNVAVAQDELAVKAARESTSRLNTHIMQKALRGDDIGFLASPVTGGGVNVNRFHQLFLLGRLAGHQTAEALAGFAWQPLNALGQKIVKEGKALETVEENHKELLALATVFEQKHLPILINLGIA